MSREFRRDHGDDPDESKPDKGREHRYESPYRDLADPLTSRDWDAAQGPRPHTYGDRLDRRFGDGPNPRDADTPREALTRFKPGRLNLPATSRNEAANRIDTNCDKRPWLEPAVNAKPVTAHVIGSLDRGGGHAIPRHEGFPTDDMLKNRVLRREDPAQLDDAKRKEGINGIKAGDKQHGVGGVAGKIGDVDAFATAVARGAEHPDVRKALETPVQKGWRPEPVDVPITDILGTAGDRFCTGFRLAGDDLKKAAQDRNTWLDELRNGREPSVPEPQAERANYEDGFIKYVFKPNESKTGYEINTMYPITREEAELRKPNP